MSIKILTGAGVNKLADHPLPVQNRTPNHSELGAR